MLLEAVGTIFLCVKTMKKFVSYMLTVVDLTFRYAVAASCAVMVDSCFRLL